MFLENEGKGFYKTFRHDDRFYEVRAIIKNQFWMTKCFSSQTVTKANDQANDKQTQKLKAEQPAQTVANSVRVL